MARGKSLRREKWVMRDVERNGERVWPDLRKRA